MCIKNRLINISLPTFTNYLMRTNNNFTLWYKHCILNSNAIQFKLWRIHNPFPVSFSFCLFKINRRDENSFRDIELRTTWGPLSSFRIEIAIENFMKTSFNYSTCRINVISNSRASTRYFLNSLTCPCIRDHISF